MPLDYPPCFNGQVFNRLRQGCVKPLDFSLSSNKDLPQKNAKTTEKYPVWPVR